MDLSRELKNSLASLSIVPGYVLTIVLTLGLTLGVLVSMFNLNFLLNFEPLPYPNQDRLVISNWEHKDDGRLRFSNAQNYPGLREMASNRDLFEQLSFIKYGEEIQQNDSKKSKILVAYTGPELMEMLATPFELGRGFQETEAKDTNNSVAVISHQFWQQHFGGEPNIIGQVIQFKDINFSIIGVTASKFIEPQLMAVGRKTQVWVPWDFVNETEKDDANWGLFFIDIFMVGKVKLEQSIIQAEHILTTRINDTFKSEVAGVPYFDKREITVTLPKFEQVILGDATSRTLMVLIGVFVLMLIAAVNITNLVMARAANNQRKFSIQAALGARKVHIFCNIFSEIWLVMTAASFLAIVVAYISNNLLINYTQEYIPRVNELSINGATLVFTFSVAWLLALIFAIVTVQQIKYRKLALALQASGKGAGLQISKKVRTFLMISQVALSAVLVTCNIYVLSTSLESVNKPIGFNIQELSYIDVDLGGVNLSTRDEWVSMLKEIKSRLIEHPAIKDISIASNAPMARTINMEWTVAVTTELGGGKKIGPGIALIDENYIPIIELPIIEGRNFSSNEAIERTKYAVINQTMANMIDMNESAIGKPLYFPRQKVPYLVIGVVKDMTIPEQNDSPRMYIPSINAASFMLKFHEGQAPNAEQLNHLLEQIHSQAYLHDMYSMEEIHHNKVSLDQIFAWCSASLALLSLVLAGVGIYGMFSYTIALRKFELGIRMAIGATPKRITTLILVDAFIPVIIGLFASVMVLYGLYLYINSATDYVVSVQYKGLITAALLILITSMIAGVMAIKSTISKSAIHALNDR
ncbi:MAG: ABC transporter permease [Gammaproteobacteria bacterium]|nr:ABC transporter permease [Gammaproteobacteria bacterium]